MSVKRALSEFRAPDETGAEERVWTVVRAAPLDRVPAARRRSGWRIAIAPALAILAGAFVFSPAGATVRRWISNELGVRHPAPALFSLPAPGRVLLSGAGGTWIVSADGSTRRLGSWQQASWSPHGRFVVVARANELAAVDPRGIPSWTLARPAVRDPRWYPPTGFRVSYLSGAQLRAVAGDGTGDHLVASGAASVAPEWRPGHSYQLAYATRRGTLVVRDADTLGVIWTTRAVDVRALSWSADGSRLLVVARARVLVYDGAGRVLTTIPLPAGTRALDGTLSPDARKLALVLAASTDEVVTANLDSPTQLRPALSGAGLRALAWSPDGRWLLVSWPAADQWVFVRVAGRPRIAAVSRIAEEFAVGASANGFPRLEGWCCRIQPTGG